MSDKYKVHRNYDVDWITMENPCRCSPPASGLTIFSPGAEPTIHQLEILESYNHTMNGTILSADNIEWDHIRVSECKAFGGDMTDHCKYSPDIFFLSLFLFFGTFFLAFFLKKFKFTSFFPARVSVDGHVF